MEIEKSKGKTMEEIAGTIGVHAVTLAKWKREYDGLHLDQARRLKELEKENARLKKIVALKDMKISSIPLIKSSGN